MIKLEEDGIYLGKAVPSSGGGGGSSTKYGASILNFIGDPESNGTLGLPSGGDTVNLVFTGIKELGGQHPDGKIYLKDFAYKFYGAQNIGSVVFPDLIEWRAEGFQGTFAKSSITSLSFPKLIRIYNAADKSSYMEGVCQDCKSLTSVSFDALQSVTVGYTFVKAFKYCTALTSVSFPVLTTVSGYNAFGSISSTDGGAFQGCTSLQTMSFPVLDSISGSSAFAMAFAGCTSLTSLSFPALTSTSFSGSTNQFNRMLNGVSGCTVHFPSNLESVIGSWSDVTAGFGGTNTTVLFDLPATE